MTQKYPISKESNLKGLATAAISSTATSGITVIFKRILPNGNDNNGTAIAIDSRTKILVFDRYTDNYEIMYFPNAWTKSGDVSTSGSGVVRGLLNTGRGYTTVGTGKTHDSNATVECVNEHEALAIIDAIVSGEIPQVLLTDTRTTFEGAGLLSSRVFADATARDVAITSPSNGDECYLTDTGVKQDYLAGSWVDREAGGTFPNASTTVAGKVEIATDAQVIAGTETGETGAKLVATPDQIASNVQNGNYIYLASAVGTDAYAITLVPIAVLTTGMEIRLGVDVANTGASTLEINGAAAKPIVKYVAGVQTALEDNDLTADQIVNLIYDGTSFILSATSQDISTAHKTLLTGGANADTAHIHTVVKNGAADSAGTNALTITIAHGLGAIPKSFRLNCRETAAGSTVPIGSSGSYNGTTYGCVGTYKSGNPGYTAEARTNVVGFVSSVTSGDYDSGVTITVTTFDATNVILTIAAGTTTAFSYEWEAST